MSKTVLIVGSGWAGYTLSQHINDHQHNVIVVSPEASTPYTPLLASAACGLFNFSLAEEPVRHKVCSATNNPSLCADERANTGGLRSVVPRTSPASGELGERLFQMGYY